jgi:hypothetical protein
MDPIAFAARFEACSHALSKDTILGRPWVGFEHSLIKPAAAGSPVIATEQPKVWFDLAALFRDTGADLRYHAALPGLLVGAGLLVTFLGLAVALSSASDIVSGDEAGRNAALQGMLGAASVKFMTSLAGLGFSIFYALFRKRRLRAVETAFDAFNNALLTLMPLKTAATLQAEGNVLLVKQLTAIERVETDFFVNMGSAFEQAFRPALETNIAPLAQAIETLSARLANQTEDAMGSMLGAFMERLEGAVGKSMEGTAATLQGLGDRLDGVQTGLTEAAARMGRAAEEMATGLGTGAETALRGLTEQMSGLVQNMRDAATTAGESNRAAGDALARQLAATASSLSAAVASFQERLEAGAAEGVSRLAAPIEDMLVQLRDMSTQQRQAGTDSAAVLAETVGRAAASLEGSVQLIATSLSSGATDASSRLVAATEAMQRDLQAVLTQFHSTLDRSGAALADGAALGGQALAGAAQGFGSAIEAAAAQLRDAGEGAGSALREGGITARAALSEAATPLASGSDLLARRISGLGVEAAALGERIVALDGVVRAASTPLAATAADLRTAGEAVRLAAEPLGRTAEAVRITLGSVDAVATTLQTAQRQTDTLATRMEAASDRFEGLDEGIAKTIRELGGQIDLLQKRNMDYVRQMDEGLAKTVRSLEGAAHALNETLPDLVEELGKRRP